MHLWYFWSIFYLYACVKCMLVDEWNCMLQIVHCIWYIVGSLLLLGVCRSLVPGVVYFWLLIVGFFLLVVSSALFLCC